MSVYKELQAVIDVLKPKRYLEVGIDRGITLLNVKAPYKVGIDIAPKIPPDYPIKVYIGASDDVFTSEEFNKEEPFDLIFIDAYHEYRQVIKDIKSALRFLALKGVIVCHDVYPFDRLDLPGLTDKQPPSPAAAWTGDVWKSVFHVRWLMRNLTYCVVKNFPGYLYLWRSDASRSLDSKELQTRVGHDHVNENIIDNLDNNWAIQNLDIMNVVDLNTLKLQLEDFLHA